MKILIVEDEFLIAEDLRLVLEDLGHIVTGTAATVPAAYEAALSTEADLAIVDTRLFGETSETVVKTCHDRGLPVVISSGHARPSLPAFADGLPLLAKPFGRADIEAVLKEAAAPAAKGDEN